jgi:peptidoglycan DL-endopeptidase CwlO
VRRLGLLAVVALAAGCAAAGPRPGDGSVGAALGGDPDPDSVAAGLAPPAPVARGPAHDGEADHEGDVDPEDAADREGDGDRDGDLTPSARETSPEDAALRTRILEAARRRLGTHPPLDCSGYVLDAYRAAGVKVALGPPGVSRSETLYRSGEPVDRPRPGDLAFFDDTYDRNRDGRRGDRFTHVALVEAVDGDAVTLLHRGGKVERIRLDLAHRDDPSRNDAVRLRRPRDVPGTRYLSGELLTAFGQLLGRDVTQTLQAGPMADTNVAHPAHHEPTHRSTVRAAIRRADRGDGRVRRGGAAAHGTVASAARVRRGAARGSAAVPPPVADGGRPRADADR